jgi:hypothetical protein
MSVLSEQLFHASPHPFKVGDVVEPRDREHAFATTSLGYAKRHLSQIRGEEGSVFTVEPVDVEDMKTETAKGDFGNYRLSKKGFRVTGKL